MIPGTTYGESESVVPKLKSERLIANSCPLNEKEIPSLDAHGNVKNAMILGLSILLNTHRWEHAYQVHIVLPAELLGSTHLKPMTRGKSNKYRVRTEA